MKPPARSVSAVIILCFLLSGVAGLVYQVVWSRYLALFLGHTSYAVVAVLVAFMGGLAVGNAWIGGVADRTRRPLALYGRLEVGIGVFALFFPTYFELCRAGFLHLGRALGPGTAGLLALKFLTGFLVIFPPAVLMGATFPLLTKFVTRSLAEVRAKVAALYTINSAGAVVGCLIADFWWIPSMGLEVTVLAGAALNLAAGLMSLLLSRSLEEGRGRTAPEAGVAASEADGETFTPLDLRLAVVGIGVSGFIAMLYEVTWTRMLGMVLGSSTHAFSLMLVTFISGIAGGSWLVWRWRGRGGTMAAFGWAETALGASLLGSMFFYEYLPYALSRMTALLARSNESYPVYHGVQALICLAVMFVPALFLGVTLPLVTRITTSELARTGRSVGRVFAVNTLGTVLGAIVTGLWLMPTLGLPATIGVGVAGNLALGLAVLMRERLADGWKPLGMLVPGAVGLVALTGWLFENRWENSFALGLWRAQQPPANLAEFRNMATARKIKYYRDGASASVAVQSWMEEGKEHLVLRVNGKPDAGTRMDMPTQRLLGHIPMFLRPSATNALIVGLGSGMTCGAVARHPNVARVDVVEISPEVAQAARFFEAHNDRVLDNPRLHLHIEDAKTFLQLTDRSYDVIISEPSNPWMAGVAGVFSKEYYESCLSRLAPGGIMAQWVQAYETDDDTLNMVLRTFGGAFKHISVWRPGISDLVLIGSTEPLPEDLAAMENRFQVPAIREDFARIDMTRLPVFLAREVVSSRNGRFVAPPDGPMHSDFLPLLEDRAQRALFVRGGTDGWTAFDENFSARPTTLLGEYLRRHPLTEEDCKAMGTFYMANHQPEPTIMRSMISQWLRIKPDAGAAVQLTAQLPRTVGVSEVESARLLPQLDAMIERAARDAEPLRILMAHLMHDYRQRRSVYCVPPSDVAQKVLRRLMEVNPEHGRTYRLLLAEIAWDRGDDAECLRLGLEAFDLDGTKLGPLMFGLDTRAPAKVLQRMMETLWRSGQHREAALLAEQVGKIGVLAKVGYRDPVLELTARKVESYLGAVPGSAP